MTIKLEIRDVAHKLALAYFCKRITFEDAYRRAHGDTKEIREDMAYTILRAISDLEKSLEDAGYSVR